MCVVSECARAWVSARACACGRTLGSTLWMLSVSPAPLSFYTPPPVLDTRSYMRACVCACVRVQQNFGLDTRSNMCACACVRACVRQNFGLNAVEAQIIDEMTEDDGSPSAVGTRVIYIIV